MRSIKSISLSLKFIYTSLFRQPAAQANKRKKLRVTFSCELFLVSCESENEDKVFFIPHKTLHSPGYPQTFNGTAAWCGLKFLRSAYTYNSVAYWTVGVTTWPWCAWRMLHNLNVTQWIVTDPLRYTARRITRVCETDNKKAVLSQGIRAMPL